MAFSFGNTSMGGQAGGAGGSDDAPAELETIQTEGLGFSALAGDAKVQLLPTPWPADQLPPAFASLMSIASRKGLIAAAGPDAVVVAKTKSVRQAFEGGVTGDNNLKAFTPELTIPMPMRISQLAFSADEAYLVLSAENGGGLAVYDVDALLTGNEQSAFELSTNGAALRALIPNPTPEKGELLAVVTVDGNLMIANLKARIFIEGPNKQILLKDGVSCVSWSTKGKQLVAGLGNGSAYQMTPDGVEKGNIPKPQLPEDSNGSDRHVSSITWLENNVFLMVHTPTQFGQEMAPDAFFHIVTRTPSSTFKFQKIDDPAGPYGVNRSPPHHFILRLREFPPNLQDVLFVTSSAALDIGLFSRSKTPLANTINTNQITGVFTVTGFADDARRAQIPVGSGMSDTSAIGLALDLSADEKVFKPIPTEDINESATPLPALMVLNHEGALASWWFVYSESVRQGTAYPGLIAAGGGVTQPAAAPAQIPSIFGGSASNNTAAGSGFALKPATTNAFGATSTSNPSTTGAFGATSGLGQKSSPWGASAASSAPQTGGTAFGTPSFGSAATLGGGTTFGKPAFGATSTPSFGASGLPGRQSVWGSGGSTTPQAAFGQTGGIARPAAPFGSSASSNTSAPSTGGFAAFASGDRIGFGGAGQNTGGSILNTPAPSPFGTSTTSAPTSTAFGGGAQTNSKSPFGSFGGNAVSENKPSIFGAASQTDTKQTPSIFGSGAHNDNKPATSMFGGVTQTQNKPFTSTGFSLGTTFKADEKSAKDNEPEKDGSQNSLFGGGFAGALGDGGNKATAETPVSNEADMDSDEVSKPAQESTTPATTPAPSKFQQPSTTPSLPSLFGSTSAQPPSTSTKPLSAGFSFASGDKPSGLDFSNLTKSTDPTPKTPITTDPKPAATTAETPATPKIKTEPESSDEHGGISRSIPEPPLPPESTSSIPKSVPVAPPATEPPLKPIPKELIPPMDVPGGPVDDGGSSDFLTEDEEDGNSQGTEEGSGEDISKDLSSASETNQTPGFTPQGSLNLLKKENSSSLFEKIELPKQPAPRVLFGEGALAPSLPPPKPKAPLSPRSPSPVRGAVPSRMLRPDAARSVSAPGAASQLLGHRQSGRPPSSSQNTYALQVEQQKAEEKRREEARARKEAEETRALVDEEDDEIQRYLAEDPLPTRTLDEFVAHTDHANLASVDSIPAQVEAVYRDINSMIDTLGLNAKHLRGFIQAHTEQVKEQARDKEDLEKADDWVLVEIENLSSIVETTLARDLEDGRVKDVVEKLETCHDLQKDLIRLRAKHEDIKRIIDAQRDPSQLAQARAQPLSAEQLAQQKDLRQEYTSFQLLLSEAEESLTLLKTKIASNATSSGRTGGSAAPTVDAIMRTITKMTSMAEKQSGNIDVLESQMRKMRFSSTVSAGSREGTPFTPQTNRQSLRNPGTSSTYGLFYTPESARDTPRNLRDSILSNSGSFAMSSPAPRKKLSGYSPEEKAQLRGKLARRKEVVDRLKGALKKAGSNVRLMDNEK